MPHSSTSPTATNLLSQGQDHHLTCAESFIEAVDPGALIADMTASTFRRPLNQYIFGAIVGPILWAA
jgi:hypothetical protein